MVARARRSVAKTRTDAVRLLVIGYMILAASTAAALYVGWNNGNAADAVDRKQCEALRHLYTSIRTSIITSDAGLDKIAYYRAHPAELRAAHRANEVQLNLYQQPPCPRVEPT